MVNNEQTNNIDNDNSYSANMSIKDAYYTTLAAGKYNSLNTNIDTSNIQTGNSIAKVNLERAEQAKTRGNYAPSHIVSSIGKKAINATEKTFKNNDDMGSQTVGGASNAGKIVYAYAKTIRKVSPAVINEIKRVPTNINKMWDVSTTLGKASVVLYRTSKTFDNNFIPFNLEFTKATFKQNVQNTGILHTATSKNMISAVKNIQGKARNIKTGVVTTANKIKTGVTSATNAVRRSYTLVRGAVNGTVVVSTVAHKLLKSIASGTKSIGLKGIKLVGKGMLCTGKGIVKGGAWTIKKGVPKVVRGVDALSLGASRALTSSGDMMLSGVGHAVTLTNYTIKTGVVTGKVTGRVVKTSVKGAGGVVKGIYRTGKGIYKGIDFVRKKGLRAAWAKTKKKAAEAAAKAGRSVVSAIVNIVKGIGKKIVIPLILGIAFICIILGVFSAPVVAVGGIFSGLFDTDNEDGTFTETDMNTFISDTSFGIPALRTEYINDLVVDLHNKLKINGGPYHYVRFKTNAEDVLLEKSVDGIESVFYTVDDLVDIIKPVYNAVLLQKYELAPTDRQAKNTLGDIFDSLFFKEEIESLEYCGQSGEDGSGDPDDPCACGRIHAHSDCPNKNVGTHTSYTCPTCCYWWCPGHPFYTEFGGGVSYCYPGCRHACSGYSYCGGHDVLTLTLSMDGLYALLDKYFIAPIEQLSNIVVRTDAEEQELQTLKDCYEFCLESINNVLITGSISLEEINNVVFVENTRVGNQAIVDFAKSQFGQVGGQLYWRWYGYSTRVEWSSCFVSWCMDQVGRGEVKYSTCKKGVNYFKNIGLWVDGAYTDVVAGDVIFFAFDGGAKAQHTGIVIGNDGQYVYAVEGNSGDSVRINKYEINSSVILGYGLMNY